MLYVNIYIYIYIHISVNIYYMYTGRATTHGTFNTWPHNTPGLHNKISA